MLKWRGNCSEQYVPLNTSNFIMSDELHGINSLNVYIRKMKLVSDQNKVELLKSINSSFT